MKRIFVKFVALVLNVIILAGLLNLQTFASLIPSSEESYKKEIEESIVDMLQNSQVLYVDEDSTFDLVNSNVDLTNEYVSEYAYVSEVEADIYFKLEEDHGGIDLYSQGEDPYPGDDMVYLTQKWLNQKYGNVTGFVHIEENGKTGWDTVRGLLRALQYELGITNITGNFGDLTSSLYSQNILCRNDNVIDNKYAILQGALWCKGYNPGHAIYDNNGIITFDAVFDEKVENAIIQLKHDAGLENPDGVVTLNVMKALMSMDSFNQLPSYYGSDPNVRSFQQKLNRKYESYIGLIPCDGVYGRNTNKAIIYALQAEEGLPVGTASGNFGPTTLLCCPEIPYIIDSSAAKRYPGYITSSHYTYSQISTITELVQFALYVNGFGDGNFNGVFDKYMQQNVRDFQKHHAINITGEVDIDTWLSLFISKGNTERSALGADCATILNAAKVRTLYNNGYRYVGRYLTGTAGGVSKALTIEEANIILNGGLRFFPIYQTSANRLEYFTSGKGKADAEAAITAASALGIPEDTIIYFAVDVDVLDGNITSQIIPYFEEVNEVMSKSIYKTGVYGTRNVCSRVSSKGYACSSFVGDMSTGYSGNLGFRLPENWAFDQFANLEGDKALGTGSGRIEIDKDAVSGRDQGVAKLNEVEDYTISSTDINFGESDEAVLEGPVINLLGIEIPLFEIDLEFNIPEYDFEISIDSAENSAKVLMGVDNLYKGSTEALGTLEKEEKYKEAYSNVKILVDSIGKGKQEFEKNFRNMKSSLDFKRSKTIIDMDTTVVLYMTINLETGKIKEGGAAIIGTACASYSMPTYIPCIYLKLQLEGSLETGLKITYDEDLLKYNMNGFTKFSLSPSIGISADVYAASAYAGLSGELSCDITTPFISFEDSFKSELSASLFFEYNVLLWGERFSWDFVNFQLYPPVENRLQLQTITENSLQFIEPLSPVSEISNNSNINIFKNCVQVYCKPQIITLGNGNLFMSYIDDVQTRSDQNRTILMYTVFDGESWSIPAPVLDDGTVDFEPILYPDENNGVHILWQNGNKIFDDSVDLDYMESNLDLHYIHWNGSSFENSSPVTFENQNFEVLHKIVASEDYISIVWAQNSENDSLLLTGTNSIYRKQFNGSSWQDIELIASDLQFVNSLDTSYNGTNNVLAYSAKTTTDSSTINDLEVFYKDGPQTVRITDNDTPDYAVSLLNDDIFWINDSTIVYTQSGSSTIETVVDNLNASSVNYMVLNNDLGAETIVWEQSSDSGVSFYSSHYNNSINGFDKPQPLAFNQGIVRGWDACLLSNGQIELVYGFAETIVNDEGEVEYGTLNLVQEAAYQYCDLCVEPIVVYDGDILVDENITLYSTVYNNGSIPINQVNVEIYDENNSLVQTNVLTGFNLNIGEKTELAIPFALPTDIARTDYRILITGIEEETVLQCDNEAVLSIGFADLVINNVTETQIGNSRQVEIVVKNQGHSVVESATLKLLDGTIYGEVVGSENITQLLPNTSVSFEFELPESKFDSGISEAARTYYITVDTQTEEYNSSNNVEELKIYPNYQVSLIAGEGGTVSESAIAVKDTNVTVTATPNEGFVFDGWYENGKCLHGIPQTYTFVATQNRTLEAYFKPSNLEISGIEIQGSHKVNEQLVFSIHTKGINQVENWSLKIEDENGAIYYNNTNLTDNSIMWTPSISNNYIVTASCMETSGYEVSYSTKLTVYSIVDGGNCGANATWSLDNFGVLRISGSGIMDNYSTRDEIFAPWWDYHDQVNTIIVEEGITRIGDRAFEGCWSNLLSVKIANSVTEIGGYAFYSAEQLDSIIIPDSVTSIGYSAFRLSGLKKVYLGTGIDYIGDLAFHECFFANVIIPENVEYIGSCSFSSNNLRTVTILNNQAQIRNDSFINQEDSITVYGYTSSTAQSYANDNGHSFCEMSEDKSVLSNIIELDWIAYLEEELPEDEDFDTYVERTLIEADNGKPLGYRDRFTIYKIHTSLGNSASFTLTALEILLENSFYLVMGEDVRITIISGYEEAHKQYKLEGEGCSVTNTYKLIIERGNGSYETDVEITVHKDLSISDIIIGIGAVRS